MVDRKGIINCSCANALYPAQASQWDKCNLTRFSTNFRFFLNATAGHWKCYAGSHAARMPVIGRHCSGSPMCWI